MDPSSLNASVYRRFLVVREFDRVCGLQAPEANILARFGQEFRGKRILDIGVGAGRTTPYLLELTEDYVGIDLSPEMVSRCQRKYPSVRFEVCDVRDLSRFADCEFDMIFFSFNGLDYLIDHDIRLRALGEIRRTLAAGGLFVFSSHNRAYRPRAPWDIRAVNLARRPLSALRALARLPFAIVNHIRMKPRERAEAERAPWDIRAVNLARRPLSVLRALARLPFAVVKVVNHIRMKPRERAEAEYALVNDDAHSYSLLTYYIFIKHQIIQLERSGFVSVEAVGLDSQWLTRDDGMETAQDPWIYYVCRK